MHDSLLKTRIEHEIAIIMLLEALGAVCAATTAEEFKAAVNRARQTMDDVRKGLSKEAA